MNSIEIGAAILLDAHRTGKLIDALPFELETQAQAYAIQAAVAKGLGPIAGWKVGLSADGTPVRAPLYKQQFYVSPASLRRENFNRFLVESELAVVFAEPLPPRADPYSVADVVAAIGGLHAAIEVADTGFARGLNVDPLWSLAAGLSHGCFILGSGIASDDLGRMNEAGYEFRIDGVPIKTGIGKHPLDDPLPILVWLANELAQVGEGIRAGDVVTTGTFTGATALAAGQSAEVTFADIGAATVSVV